MGVGVDAACIAGGDAVAVAVAGMVRGGGHGGVLAGVVDVGAESEGGVGAFGAVLLAVSAALLPGGEEGAFADRDASLSRPSPLARRVRHRRHRITHECYGVSWKGR
jgi:hypothetical protein